MDKNSKDIFETIDAIYKTFLNAKFEIKENCNCTFCIAFKKTITEKTESKEVKEPEFKVGDVVVLKSGGCDMTIKGIDNNDFVTCAYMNYMSKVEWVTLNKNAIKKVKHVI